jgi:hypothetical protein
MKEVHRHLPKKMARHEATSTPFAAPAVHPEKRASDKCDPKHTGQKEPSDV